MHTEVIDGKIINFEQIHFVRRKSPTEILISFGTDFVLISKKSDEIDKIFDHIMSVTNASY